jgi:hypothetical protein
VKNYVIFSLRSKTGKFEAKQFVIFLLDAKREKKPIEAKKYTLLCSLSFEAKNRSKKKWKNIFLLPEANRSRNGFSFTFFCFEAIKVFSLLINKMGK